MGNTTTKFSTQLKALPLELKLDEINAVAQSLTLQGNTADAAVVNTLHDTLLKETSLYFAVLNSEDALTKHKAYKTFCANSHSAIKQAKLQIKELPSYLRELNQIQLVVDEVAASLLGYKASESLGRTTASFYGNSGKAIANANCRSSTPATPEIKAG